MCIHKKHNIIIAFSELSPSIALDLSRLPPLLIEEGRRLPPERGQQYLACRVLLAELLYQYCGIEQLPELILGDNGRPIFADPTLPDFNISHSGHSIAVALTNCGRVGLDIEVCRERKKWLSLAEYSFSHTELVWLKNLAADKQQNGFWYLWTLRESILKLAGKGVWQMKSIRIEPESQKVDADFIAPTYHWSDRVDALFIALSSDNRFDQVHLLKAILGSDESVRLIPVHPDTDIDF